MFIDKEHFDSSIRRLTDRLDRIERLLEKPQDSEKEALCRDGEIWLDNQDVCTMLNISKRTLQRFRSSKMLPYHRGSQKTYYKKTEVLKFMDKYLTCINPQDGNDKTE